jgi:guanosine-3',5'-bis(diphosphate) 3'-pyrophosphohydrolase
VFDVDDPLLLAAALLHDLIEDTSADYDEVAEEFGTEVADIVAYLTKDMRLPEPEREEEYDRRLAEASWQVRLIKLADVYDNLSDTVTTKKPVEKAIEKAQRAIALAGNDPQLESAVAAVEALIKKKTSAKR